MTTQYGWDMGWNVIHEESAGGTLQKSYVMSSPQAEVGRILADIAGTNPATGTARYYFHDHLGSTRRLYSATRTLLGTYRFTPYGSVHSQSGAALDTLGGTFTGKPWDSAAQLYYFPYRYYSPTMARWTSRDPLGMVDGPNMYGYVRGNPVNRMDPLGGFSMDRPYTGGPHSGGPTNQTVIWLCDQGFHAFIVIVATYSVESLGWYGRGAGWTMEGRVENEGFDINAHVLYADLVYCIPIITTCEGALRVRELWNSLRGENRPRYNFFRYNCRTVAQQTADIAYEHSVHEHIQRPTIPIIPPDYNPKN